jgi:WD40 repeat protein
LACSPSTSTIAVGTELANHQASILLWDIRGAQPAPKAAYHDLHSDDITQLAFHPSPAQAQLLLSGSTDGLVSVHDTSVADEDELTIQTLNLNASIHRAAFIGGAQAQATSLVGALSHDERFAVYDVGEERSSGDAVRDFGDLRAVLGCQYVADVVPKADGTGAILGAGSQDKAMFQLVFLSQTPAGTWELDQESSVGLPGAHSEEIVRAFCFFDEEQTVFTAGEDGMVKAWRPGG